MKLLLVKFQFGFILLIKFLSESEATANSFLKNQNTTSRILKWEGIKNMLFAHFVSLKRIYTNTCWGELCPARAQPGWPEYWPKLKLKEPLFQ